MTGDGSIYCQLSSTYLPASRLPERCRSTDGSWSVINTLLVGATTMFNTSLAIVVIFLWMVNRQFHLSKNKHSYDRDPLGSVKIKKARQTITRAGRSIRRFGRKDLETIEESEQLDQAKQSEKDFGLKRLSSRGLRPSESFRSFLEADNEEDEAITRSLSGHLKSNKQSKESLENIFDEVGVSSTKNQTRDLLNVAFKIEAFSYLSPDALVDILKHVEYLDFEKEGEDVFEKHSLDGSIYAVVSGEVTTTLAMDGANEEFTMVSGEGGVISSMLMIILSLISHYQVRETLMNSSPLPGLLRGGLMGSDNPFVTVTLPEGISVKAAVTQSHTRVLKIPTQCYAAILEKYPRDVANVCQTILARLQRVTIQTLVRFLGLEGGIFGSSGFPGKDDSPPRVAKQSAAWENFEKLLLETAKPSSIIDRAIVEAGSMLGLTIDQSQVLRDGAAIVSVAKGESIIRMGESSEFLVLVLKGAAEVGLVGTGDSARPLFVAGCGTFLNLLACFTQDPNVATSTSKEDSTIVLKLPVKCLHNAIAQHPRALVHCLREILDRIGNARELTLSAPMFLIDWMTDWMHKKSGENVVNQGEVCESLYVVLNGRLREDSKDEVPKAREYGRGSTIGELECLASKQWAHSIYATRHAELARIPVKLLTSLMQMYPSSGLHFAKVIAESRLQSESLALPSIMPSYSIGFATIAVVPLSTGESISNFCTILAGSLNQIAPTKHLTKTEVKSMIGREGMQVRNTLLRVKLTRTLGDIEENNRLVLFEAESKFSWWTRCSIQQADCVLLLVDADTTPESSKIEECVEWMTVVKKLRVELVVLEASSSEKTDDGAGLNDWIGERDWISRYHRVREGRTNDFHRLSRRVTGKSVGLVLGGGGARGLAHLGVIKALHETGVPVDLCGGTSQGAFVGSLLARSPDDLARVHDSCKEMATEMSKLSNKLKDITFPVVSFFNGHYFNKTISDILGVTRIEDFPLNFFCVSVDIKNNELVVHDKGVAWKWVRASMSLAGYLPPVAEDGRLLVDGGYLSVVPTGTMSERGARHIIAVDVSKGKTRDYANYGAELSGFWLLYNSWNPFVKTVNIPSMGDINNHLRWVQSENERSKVKENLKDGLFLRPPVGEFGTLDFHMFDEIVDIGYEYALPLVRKWAEENGYAKA